MILENINTLISIASDCNIPDKRLYELLKIGKKLVNVNPLEVKFFTNELNQMLTFCNVTLDEVIEIHKKYPTYNNKDVPLNIGSLEVSPYFAKVRLIEKAQNYRISISRLFKLLRIELELKSLSLTPNEHCFIDLHVRKFFILSLYPNIS
jgi:hypothetical protein